jgi:enamine deaminase RidA (YjgF/YER057c/UK114 family)
MTAAENLNRLGVTLPSAPPAVANYVAWVRTGNLIVISGQLPWEGSVLKYTGRLGRELTTAQGYQAARLATINGLAQIYQATGDLEKVVHVVRLEGNVFSDEKFTEQPQVLNGASDLLVKIFEGRGRHTRTALGTSAMPLRAAVQLSFWVEVHD